MLVGGRGADETTSGTWSRPISGDLRSCPSEGPHFTLRQKPDVAGANTVLGARRMVDRADQLRTRPSGEIRSGRVEGTYVAHVHIGHHQALVHGSAFRSQEIRAKGVGNGRRDA